MTTTSRVALSGLLAALMTCATSALVTGVLATAALAIPAQAAACREQSQDGISYTVCEADIARDTVALFLNDANGRPLASFERVAAGLAADQTLAFAMNAGMYHPDRRPVGLYLDHGVEAAPLIKSASAGNFGLLPNGVFCIAPDQFAVIETLAYAANPPACTYATQSGPMLVIGGALHPRFLPNSDSRYVRNGVGVSADGSHAYFVISNARVSFSEFGMFFRDTLQTPNALYFDGSISRLYAPGLRRNDIGFPMGPMVGVVATAP